LKLAIFVSCEDVAIDYRTSSVVMLRGLQSRQTLSKSQPLSLTNPLEENTSRCHTLLPVKLKATAQLVISCFPYSYHKTYLSTNKAFERQRFLLSVYRPDGVNLLWPVKLNCRRSTRWGNRVNASFLLVVITAKSGQMSNC